MKTLSSEIALKRKIWDACMQKQQALAATVKEAMTQAQEAANEEKGSLEEKFESFREQLIRDRDMYARKLGEHMSAMEALRYVEVDKVFSHVQQGALVITDKQKLFVAISLGEIKADGQVYFAISTQSPLYQQMEGKRAGETFEFRGISHHIREVF